MPSLMDSWALQQFPGRFLEEIDGIDWGRYQRALKAGRIEQIEAQRQAAITDIDKMTPELAALIVEHDRLLDDYGE